MKSSPKAGITLFLSFILSLTFSCQNARESKETDTTESKTANSAPAEEGESNLPAIQDNLGLIAENAQPNQVSEQFSFTEGPAVDKEGNIFFTDQPNNKIWKYGTDGKLSVFMEEAGRANGLYFDEDGNLLAAADDKNQLWSISPEGEVTVLLDKHKGAAFNGPNDIWVAPQGGIYFTDPYYQRPYWTREKPEMEGQKVYYIPEGQQEALVVADDVVKPNGIIGTPDGKYLYVADIGDQKTYRYTIAADGKLKDRQLFTEMGSDGMTIDEQGNIYLTGEGVTIFNPQGQQVGQIPIPEDWTANITFGGKDRKTLFITASEAVYVLPMQVAGVQ